MVAHTKKPIPVGKLPKTFAGLYALHTLRPLHDHADYENALDMLKSLMGRKLTEEQLNYLGTLAELVKAYTTKNHARLPRATGGAVLAELKEQNGLSNQDMARIIGVDRTHVSKIIHGHRQLTVAQIKALSAHFKLRAETFMG